MRRSPRGRLFPVPSTPKLHPKRAWAWHPGAKRRLKCLRDRVPGKESNHLTLSLLFLRELEPGSRFPLGFPQNKKKQNRDAPIHSLPKLTGQKKYELSFITKMVFPKSLKSTNSGSEFTLKPASVELPVRSHGWESSPPLASVFEAPFGW